MQLQTINIPLHQQSKCTFVLLWDVFLSAANKWHKITFISTKTSGTFSCVYPPYLKYRKRRQSEPKQCHCTVISQTLDGAKQHFTEKYRSLLQSYFIYVQVDILYLVWKKWVTWKLNYYNPQANYDGCTASADMYSRLVEYFAKLFTQ